MRIEERLYVIIREAVGNEFESRTALAQHISDLAPAEFKYTRLEHSYVMEARSILNYVTFLCFLGIIESKKPQGFVCTLSKPPTPAGAEELIKRACIKKLEDGGFTAEKLKRVFRKLISGAKFVLPTQRDVYNALSLSIEEKEFLQITNLGAIREHYKYSLVTRRLMTLE